VQRVVRPAEFLLVEQPGRRIETGAADLLRHVGGIEPRRHRLLLQLADQVHRQPARPLHLALVRIELVLDEGAGGLDDERLFFGQAEMHGSILSQAEPVPLSVAAARRHLSPTS
jgi:hypothetical protein